ncbi:MAG: hypothetical protein ACRCUJ_00900 [Phocaeicola sp.]
MVYAYTNRERDMLLMGSLATLSAALPRVEFSYFNRMQAPPFYFWAVAPAGKGTVQAGSGILRMKRVLRKMATTFTLGEGVRVAHEMGIPKASIDRYLKKMMELKLPVKEGDNYRKTGRHWPK